MGYFRRGILRCAWLVALLIGISVPSAFGQAETGIISGTVTDPSGAVVPGAKITVRNVDTGTERLVESDSHGFYTVSNLQPGLYSIAVEASNLTRKEQRAQVTVGSRIEVNVQLSLGPTSTTVEVTSEGGVQVNTETATIGTVIDSQQIQSLPTINRNPYTFAQYVGTASDGDPSGRGVGVSFNGLRSAGTNVLLDGAANNDEFTASVGQTIPLDSVQEYSVLTNNFTAEYGRASSAVVNLSTKGGTNNFHGSAYEYNRVSALAAQDFFDKAQGNPKQAFTRNQFGGSIGGPIKKDKLFFFGNAEWNRIRSSANATNAVIDPAFVALANANTVNFYQKFGTLRSNARVTQTFTMAQAGYCSGAGALAQCADPTLASTPFLDLVNYSVPADAGAGSPQNQELVVGRVDWNVSDKTTVYARYALNKSDLFAGTVSNSAYAGYDTGEAIQQNNMLLSMTHTFGAEFTSQSKLVFNRLNDFQPLGSQPISPGLYFNPAVATGTKLGVDLMLPGYLPTAPGNGIPFGGPQNFLQFYQDFSKLKGKHILRFGGSYDYQRDNRTFGAYETPVASFAAKGGIATASLNNFLNGTLGQFQGAIDPQGKFPCPFNSFDQNYNKNNPPKTGCFDTNLNDYPLGEVTTPVSQPVFARSNRYQEFAFYGADQWRVSTRFTLNLGLRWEYFGVQHNKNPQLDSNYYLGAGGSLFTQIRNGEVALTSNSPVGGLWNKDWNNFGPKLGFAWDVAGNGKTVVRGGYSIAYERNFGNVTFNVIQNPPNYSVISLVAGVDVPTIPVTTSPAGPLAGSGTVKAIPNVSLRAVNPNIRTSYAHLYSLTLEREIRHNFVFGLDYSGSEGEKLYDIANVNRPGAGNVYLGDSMQTSPFSRLRATQYSNINFRSDNGKSHYNALVARVQMSNWANTGLTLNSNFTYGHALDELSDTFSSSGNEFNLGYLDPFNPKVDYGNSYTDIRKRFTSAVIWDIPFGKSLHGVAKQALGGWSVSALVLAETGTPFSVFDCTNALTICPYAFNKVGTSGIPRSAPSSLVPTGLPDNFIYTPFTTSGGAALFDSSYVNPIVGISDFGPFPANMNARNAFRGPGLWNTDLGIFKTFFLSERFRLQFRGELYNAFNHANLFLASNGGDVDVSANGFVDAQKGGFGNSHRNVQLALRLTF